MKKIIITSILCLVAFISISAEKYTYYFNLKLKNYTGASVSIPLEKKPVLTYEYDKDTGWDMLVLKTTDPNLSYAFNLADKYNVYYTKSDKTPASIISAVENSKFCKNGDIVAINGLSIGEMVSVYSANGTKVAEVSADANGVAVIDLSPLPKGVIIMKSLGASFKIAH